MVTQKGNETREQLMHVDLTAPITEIDKKLRPLTQRREELAAKMRRMRGILDPYVDVNGDEDECLQARIDLPEVEINLSKLAPKIRELERKRIPVRKVEMERIELALDREEDEILRDLDAIFENILLGTLHTIDILVA